MKDYLFQLVFLVILTSSGICNAPKDNAVIASKGNPGNDIASLGNTENDMASLGNTENDMSKDINKKHPNFIHGKKVCEKDWRYDEEEKMCIKCPAIHHTEKEFYHCWMEEEDIVLASTTSQPATSQSTTTVPKTTVKPITKQTTSLLTAASIESTTEKNVDWKKVDSTTMVLTQTAEQVSHKDTSTSATAKEELLTQTIPLDIDPKKKENQDGVQPVTVALGVIVGVQLIIILVLGYLYYRKCRDCKCSPNNFSKDKVDDCDVNNNGDIVSKSHESLRLTTNV